MGRIVIIRVVNGLSDGPDFVLRHGPIVLTEAPRGADLTYSAQRHGRFRFRMANGRMGTLFLAPRAKDIYYVLDGSQTAG